MGNQRGALGSKRAVFSVEEGHAALCSGSARESRPFEEPSHSAVAVAIIAIFVVFVAVLLLVVLFLVLEVAVAAVAVLSRVVTHATVIGPRRRF